MKLKTLLELIKSQAIFFSLTAVWLSVGAVLLFSFGKVGSHLTISSHHTIATDLFFKLITFLGDGLAALVVALFLVMINYRKAIVLLVGVYGAGFITQILKRFVFNDHYRPVKFIGKDQLVLVDGVDMHEMFSFPSGHTTAVFALAFMLLFLFPGKKNQVIFFFIAALAAYSRIYLSQHFIEVVIAGTVIGIVVPLIVLTLFYPKLAMLSGKPIGTLK